MVYVYLTRFLNRVRRSRAKGHLPQPERQGRRVRHVVRVLRGRENVLRDGRRFDIRLHELG